MPKLIEILRGIQAEERRIQNDLNSHLDAKEKKFLSDSVCNLWEIIFECSNFGPLEEEIDRNALSDPDNQITMNILYIYSMESFICKMINDATRNQDETKIQTLGPFAAVLTQILSLAYANTEEAQKIQKPASKSKMFMGGIDKN